MTRIFKYLMVSILLLALACDEKFVFVDCEECTQSEPISAAIKVLFDPKGFERVLLSVYEGNFEDNILFNTYDPTAPEIEITLKLNRKYTFVANYTDSYGKAWVVIDSIFPRVKYETDQCDSPCYFAYDTKIKLRLKYYSKF